MPPISNGWFLTSRTLFRWLIDSEPLINVMYTGTRLYEEINYKEELDKAKEKFN